MSRFMGGTSGHVYTDDELIALGYTSAEQAARAAAARGVPGVIVEDQQEKPKEVPKPSPVEEKTEPVFVGGTSGHVYTQGELTKLGYKSPEQAAGAAAARGVGGGTAGVLPVSEVKRAKEFEATHIKLPGGTWIESAKWQQLPEKYKALAPKGYEYIKQTINKDTRDFEANHTQLADGKWIANDDWNSLPNSLKDIGKSKGFEAMIAKQEQIIKAIEPYKQGEGYNLALALNKGAVTANDLNTLGFDKAAINQAMSETKASEATGIPLMGDRQWLNMKTGSVISDTEYQTLSNRDLYRLTNESSKRFNVEIATFVFPPAKAALPEYTINDVTPLEWGMGASNIALIVVPVTMPAKLASGVAGKSISKGVQLAAGGIFTAQTVKEWPNMSNTERAISVFIDTVLIGSAVRGLKPSSVKGTASEASQKAQEAISRLFPKATPETKATYTGLNQITEGGRIGPWANYSDTELVRAVANGKKSIAWIEGTGAEAVDALKAAREAGLKVQYQGRAIAPGTYELPVIKNGKVVNLKWVVKEGYKAKNYIVFRDDATSRLALDRFLKAEAIERTTPEGLIRYHTEIGKSLGYRPQDIRAFINNMAASDAGVKAALNDLNIALITDDKILLKQAAARLELAAGKLPKELGSPIINRLKIIKANPGEWIDLAKKPPANPELVNKGLSANKQFIDIAERQLRRVKDPAKKAVIEKALKEAKKQVKVAIATKTKLDIPLESVGVSSGKAGKFMPAVVKSKEVIKVGSKRTPIPVRELGTKKLGAIATRYNVTRGDILIAYSKMPIEQKRILIAVNPDIARRVIPVSEPVPSTGVKEAEVVAPITTPAEVEKTSPMVSVQPEAETKPAVKEATKLQTSVKESTKVRPSPAPAHMPKYPSPTPIPIQEKKRVLLPRGASDKDKRKRIKSSKGAVSWNMGKLQGKDVWHTQLDTGEHLVVLGHAPEGASILADGPGSAYKTTQRIGSKSGFPLINYQHGAVRATIRPSGIPKGANISFNPMHLKSKPVGKMFITKVRGSTLLSRHPLDRRKQK